MSILLAVLPALCWGLNPLIVKRIHGHPENEIFRTGVGTLITGLVVYVIQGFHITIGITAIFLSILSGAAWAIGILGQYVSYKTIGVSKTMPISTGLQLIGTAIIGVLMFGEWAEPLAKSIGFGSVLLLILGAYFVSKTNNNTDGSTSLTTYLPLLLTTIGFWIYSSIPKVTAADGIQMFTWQMLGIFVVAIIYAFSKDHHILIRRESWRNVGPGLLYGLAALAYIYAARAVGVTTAYIIGQLAVVISTLGGIFLLNERKTGTDLIRSLMGLGLIVIGSLTTAFI